MVETRVQHSEELVESIWRNGQTSTYMYHEYIYQLSTPRPKTCIKETLQESKGSMNISHGVFTSSVIVALKSLLLKRCQKRSRRKYFKIISYEESCVMIQLLQEVLHEAFSGAELINFPTMLFWRR